MQTSTALFVFAALAAALSAQVPTGARSGPNLAHVADAIRQWVVDYETGRLQGNAILRDGEGLQPRYVASARKAGLLLPGDAGRITHLDMLGKFLFLAEKHPDTDLVDAVLGVAGARLQAAFLDREASEVRELGHWTLMRTDHQGGWFLILRAAAGDRIPVLGELLPPPDPEPGADGTTAGPARRVAALQLIGRKNLPVFRSTLEAALVDADPRVRLAAAEALSPPWRQETVQRLAAALLDERHPVVSQGMVRCLLAMLQRPPEGLDAAARGDIVASALRQFGRVGWRTDMDLLDLVEAFPHRNAVPTLIAALDLELTSPDALLTAVNKRASPQRRERALALLRAMTGALLPNDDSATWLEFWQRERDKIVIPERLKKPQLGETRATFFGVPVTGSSIAFLIDTSGSMEHTPATVPVTGRRRQQATTRLAAAKEQLLHAVQAMPPESQYSILTFSAGARDWTPTPIQAGGRSTRSLTELLSRLVPHGGTNLHDGLELALQWQARRYAELPTCKIDELFVLSDGEPTAGPVQEADELLEMVREANKYTKVRIHCVFTGQAGGKGSELLRQLAEQNGGVFVQR